MKRNGAAVRLRWLTPGDDNLDFQMDACPLCWVNPGPRDQIVTSSKGTGHVCRQCAEGIAELIQSGGMRRCSRRACSETFQGRGRYCSNACRQAAYRQRA